MNGIGKVGIDQLRSTISIWRVALPFDIDRDKYIQNCYLTGSITIANENGERMPNIKIGKIALQLIDFPLTTDTLGSKVCCVSTPYSGDLYVIEVYYTDEQYLNQSENQYRFLKSSGIGTASILVDGSGNIVLSVNGDSDNGVMTLNITNKDRNGKLNINVNGDVTLTNDGNVTLKTSKQILIDSPKILLNNSEEPVLLGKKTVELLSDWLDQLGKESAGPYPLLGQSFYTQLKQKLEDLKSKITFVK